MNAMRTLRPLAAALMLAAGASIAAAAAPQSTPTAPAPGAAHATPTTSAPARPAALPDFDALDGNRDGIVTLPEIDVYSRPLIARVQHCDTDRSPGLSRTEYANCTPKDAAAVAQHALPRQPAHKAARDAKAPAHDTDPAGRS